LLCCTEKASAGGESSSGNGVFGSIRYLSFRITLSPPASRVQLTHRGISDEDR